MGGFRYTNEPLRLGQLQGNLFRIVLRCLQPSEEALIRNALIDLQTYGFINYFGLQRFGSGQTPTHHIGIALLQGNWRKALDLILTGSLLSPMDDEAPSTRTELLRPILETYLRDRDATSALAQMDALPRPLQRGLHLERRLLQAECRYGTKDLQAIFHSLPRNLRTLYLHAVQSYVWNEMASERIRQFGAREVHPGDLVAMKSPTPGTGHLDLGEAGSTDNADDPALLDCSEDSSLPLHTESPESGSSERDVALIHEVTAADVALQRYTIYDVVLPVPGLSTGTISCPAAAQAYCRFVDAYQVALIGDEASALGRQYCMRGTYRRLLIRPAEMHHRFIRHETLREPLTKTDLDVYPVHENNEHDDTATNDASRPFLACEIRFRLPASSYATMLLRELTKSETDRWTQSRQVTEPSTALASHALSLLNSGNDSKSPK
jgi:tRNA pseudouridine13 synthase